MGSGWVFADTWPLPATDERKEDKIQGRALLAHLYENILGARTWTGVLYPNASFPLSIGRSVVGSRDMQDWRALRIAVSGFPLRLSLPFPNSN